MVRLAGAEPVIVPTMERNLWKMRAADFENAMTPRTKMLILNSPCNPTGSVYTREELQAIVDVAAEEDIYILSDEIYEKLVYDDAQHVSIASLSKARVLVIWLRRKRWRKRWIRFRATARRILLPSRNMAGSPP